MAELVNYPFVNQLNSPTLDGRADENKWFNCVICSILSAMLYRKPELRGHIEPDSIKDAVLGEGYQNEGTDAHWFVNYVAKYGLKLYPIECQGSVAQEAHKLIESGYPAIFTEIDPYVNTSLPQYAGWTHVCSFFKEIPGGLAAMDPFGGKLVEKSDAAWSSVIVGKELWTVELEQIVINIQQVAGYFTENDAHHWTCKATGKVLQYAILDAYKSYGNADLCGLSFLGLPRSNEIQIEHLGPKYQHLAGKGIVVQVFERGDLVYDTGHLLDSAPGISGAVYPAHIYDGVGADLLAAQGGAPTQITGIDPVKVKDRLTAIGLASHNGDAAIQQLVNQAI